MRIEGTEYVVSHIIVEYLTWCATAYRKTDWRSAVLFICDVNDDILAHIWADPVLLVNSPPLLSQYCRRRVSFGQFGNTVHCKVIVCSFMEHIFAIFRDVARRNSKRNSNIQQRKERKSDCPYIIPRAVRPDGRKRTRTGRVQVAKTCVFEGHVRYQRADEFLLSKTSLQIHH